MVKAEHNSDARVLVGIDISKNRHEVLIAVPGKARRRRMTVLNTAKDYRRLIDALRESGWPVTVGFEATGNYHRALWPPDRTSRETAGASCAGCLIRLFWANERRRDEHLWRPLIQPMTEALAHAKGEGPAIVHDPITPRDVREQADLTQAQMAPLMGMSLSGYRKWEQGQRRVSGHAATLLRLIQREPDAVKRALLS